MEIICSKQRVPVISSSEPPRPVACPRPGCCLSGLRSCCACGLKLPPVRTRWERNASFPPGFLRLIIGKKEKKNTLLLEGLATGQRLPLMCACMCGAAEPRSPQPQNPVTARTHTHMCTLHVSGMARKEKKEHAAFFFLRKIPSGLSVCR